MMYKGYLSRWIGFLGVLMFLSVVVSGVNLLQVVPLFFLGSTLIFIGIDLLYEWVYEVFHKLIPSEYLVLLATFVAIQVLGIDGGIVFGVIIAVVEYVVSTSRVSSMRRVMKQSRAVWQPYHRKLLQEVGYDTNHPKILTLEIRETVFFGSSLLLLSRICDEIGISASPTDMMEMSLASPRHFSKSPMAPTATSLISSLKKRRRAQESPEATSLNEKRRRPKYLLLDLSQVPNVDASAARSCFLQLAKMCHKNGIIMIATGANPRVDWILRSHDVAYSTKDEEMVKSQLLYPHHIVDTVDLPHGKVLLFDSLNVALQHCETRLIFDLEQKQKASLSTSVVIPHSLMDTGHLFKAKLSTIFSRLLGIAKENQVLNCFEEGGIAQVEEVSYYSEDEVYTKGENADSFYVVLAGGVEIRRDASDDFDIKASSTAVMKRLSFADRKNIGKSSFGEVVSYLQVGGIFGYIDFMLDRRRLFNAVCSKDDTVLAKFTKSTLEELEQDSPDVHRIIEKALLQASLMELANFDVA
jgi:Sulfate permease and related transporters (MFS superfamily)